MVMVTIYVTTTDNMWNKSQDKYIHSTVVKELHLKPDDVKVSSDVCTEGINLLECMSMFGWRNINLSIRYDINYHCINRCTYQALYIDTIMVLIKDRPEMKAIVENHKWFSETTVSQFYRSVLENKLKTHLQNMICQYYAQRNPGLNQDLSYESPIQQVTRTFKTWCDVRRNEGPLKVGDKVRCKGPVSKTYFKDFAGFKDLAGGDIGTVTQVDPKSSSHDYHITWAHTGNMTVLNVPSQLHGGKVSTTWGRVFTSWGRKFNVEKVEVLTVGNVVRYKNDNLTIDVYVCPLTSWHRSQIDNSKAQIDNSKALINKLEWFG